MYAFRRSCSGYFVLFIILILTGCGGSGGSSSGGGNSTATEGLFSGTFRITITAPGDQVVDGGTMTILIKEDQITRDPARDGTSAALNGNSFTLVASASRLLGARGSDCKGNIVQIGKVLPGRVVGNIFSSNVTCDGVPFKISGTFSASFSRPN